VATHLEDEVGHEIARDLIRAVMRSGIRVDQPTITLVEVASALRRRGIDRDEIKRRVAWLAGLEGSRFYDLDLRAAMDAAGAAISAGLRAADAIYLATARHTGATVITFDQELLAAKVPGVRVMTPEAWLAAYG
jgi:predicted nucleic acid-binding protein